MSFSNELKKSIIASTYKVCCRKDLLMGVLFSKAACDGEYDFVGDIKEYAVRTARIKEILLRNGFSIVYDKDVDEPVSDGFFFTIGYKDMDGGELLRELLYYGISGIDLATTGGTRKGIRACSSNIKPHHYAMLEERLRKFNENH